MVEPAASRPRISDTNFRRAVELIDSGDLGQLRDWLEQHPGLLAAVADEDGSFAGEYFKHPKLLWFVAENPIRNGKLPGNIGEVARTIIDAARRHGVKDINHQVGYTLSLVCSGCVAQQFGVQDELIAVLVSEGGDPTGALAPALAHGQVAACESLLKHGAVLTLGVAAGLGRVEDLQRLFEATDEMGRYEALALAATNGQPTAARILVDRGVDPNRYCPDGFHAHTTPLHQAVASGSLGTACTLVTRGADMTLRDKIHDGNALDWARHMDRVEILAFLENAGEFMPAVRAVRSGDVDALGAWLARHAARVNDRLGDNPRSLLHYATDWPGRRPRVGEMIRLLIEAGADPDARLGDNDAPGTQATETPLHWAASCDDVEAVEALIQGGAKLDPSGGCIASGTPLFLAVIYKQWRAAEALIDAGARFDLPLAAGVGRMKLVETFFDDAGRFQNPYGDMPYRETSSDPQRELDAALIHAASGGRLEVVRFLVERGANVRARSPVDMTALDEALGCGSPELVDYLRSLGAKTFEQLAAESSG